MSNKKIIQMKIRVRQPVIDWIVRTERVFINISSNQRIQHTYICTYKNACVHTPCVYDRHSWLLRHMC